MAKAKPAKTKTAKAKPAKTKQVPIDLSLYAKNLALVESDLGESMLLFDQASENVYALNVTAKILWVTFTESVTPERFLNALNTWFTAQVPEAQGIAAINQAFEEFIRLRIVLVNTDRFAGFPIGREVRINQLASNIQFVDPQIATFTKSFLKTNHPGLWGGGGQSFSDTWGRTVS